MKLSIEAKVAGLVAAGFVAVTVGVVAQGNNAVQADQASRYSRTNNPGGGNTYMTQQGYERSLFDRTGPEEDSLRRGELPGHDGTNL